MIEDLGSLLREAADGLLVPPAPTPAITARGRAVRRRRRRGRMAGGLVLALVVAGGVGAGVVAHGGDGRHRAAEAPALHGAVFSVGTTLYLDDGARAVAIHDTAITSLYYTSAGVLVRSGDSTASDGGGPTRFTLVRPDGSTRRLAVTLEETAPSTDPDQPYLAYATATPDGVQVVVVDVRDDTEAARVTVPGASGTTTPGVSLDGDRVYVGARPGQPAHVVDWRTGAVSTSTTALGLLPSVHAGRTVTAAGGGLQQVVRVDDGGMLVRTVSSGGRLALSPDGRYALLADGRRSRVVDLTATTPAELDLSARPWELGWGPDDSVFTVSGDLVTTCSATTGSCVGHRLDAPVDADTLRLGGQTYES